MAGHTQVPGVSSQNVGIIIAVISSFINGLALVLLKKGSSRSKDRGSKYDGLTDVVWWSGTLSMIIGQIGNGLALNLAPAVIVTPLGALGIVFGAVLAAWILEEHLNRLGKLGCVLCCCGSVVLSIHAPEGKKMSVPELEDRLLDPVFLTYALVVVLLLIALIVWIAPAHGRSNDMVYVAICSLFGNFTVPSCKGLGLVIRDRFGDAPASVRDQVLFLLQTLAGLSGGSSDNRALALFLLGTLVVSMLTQFFFINKASKCFSSNMFGTKYYVMFTSTVILACALLFKEWTALSVTDGLAMFCSLVTMCVGVDLLRISQEASIALKKKKEEERKKTN